MELRGAEPNRGFGAQHRESGEGGEGRPSGQPEERSDPGRAERFVLGAETGVRRFVRLAAVLLWIPFGFVFWIPFLLRRTVSYVFAVLYAGLIGGQTDGAERRWEQAVSFYQLGFRRILHAFRSEEGPPLAIGGTREPEDGVQRFVLEAFWAVVVWAALLWLVGVWPDAPQAVRSALLDVWEAMAGAGRQVDAWIQELLAR